jgi:hypothetical protein
MALKAASLIEKETLAMFHTRVQGSAQPLA